MIIITTLPYVLQEVFLYKFQLAFLGEKSPNHDACDRALKQKLYANSMQKVSGENVSIKALAHPAMQIEQIHQEASQRYFHTEDTRHQSILQMAKTKGGINVRKAEKNFPYPLKIIEQKSPLDNTSAKEEASLQYRKLPKEETSYVEYRGVSEVVNVKGCFDTGQAIIILRQTQSKSPDNEIRARRQVDREEETERSSFLQIKDVSGAARDITVKRYKNDNSEIDTVKIYRENKLIIKRENNNNKNSEICKTSSINVKGLSKDYEMEDGELFLQQEARNFLKEPGSPAHERFFTCPNLKDLDKEPLESVAEGGELSSSSLKDPLTSMGGKLTKHSPLHSCKEGERVQDASKDEDVKKCSCSIEKFQEVENSQKYLAPSLNCLKVAENSRYLKKDATNSVIDNKYVVGNRGGCNRDIKVIAKVNKEGFLHHNLAEISSVFHNGRPRRPTEYIKDNEHFNNHKKYRRYHCHNKQATCMDEICRCSTNVSLKESQEKGDKNENAAKYRDSSAKGCNIDIISKDAHIETTNTQQVLIYCPPDVAPRLRNGFPVDKKCNVQLVTKRNSNKESCEEHLGEKLAIHTRSNRLCDLIQGVANVASSLTRSSNASHFTRKRNSGILGKRRGTSN